MLFSESGTVMHLGNIGGIMEPKSKDFYENDPIFHRLQYEIRAAFEEGWRAAGGDPVRSPHNQGPVGWRLAWINSSARKFLVANGINTGRVRWK